MKRKKNKFQKKKSSVNWKNLQIPFFIIAVITGLWIFAFFAVVSERYPTSQIASNYFEFKSVIQVLNDNSGFLSFVLTFFTVFFLWFSINLTKKQVSLARESFKQKYLPKLRFLREDIKIEIKNDKIEIPKNIKNIKLINLGAGFAYDLNIIIFYKTLDSDGPVSKAFRKIFKNTSFEKDFLYGWTDTKKRIEFLGSGKLFEFRFFPYEFIVSEQMISELAKKEKEILEKLEKEKNKGNYKIISQIYDKTDDLYQKKLNQIFFIVGYKDCNDLLNILFYEVDFFFCYVSREIDIRFNEIDSDDLEKKIKLEPELYKYLIHTSYNMKT